MWNYDLAHRHSSIKNISKELSWSWVFWHMTKQQNHNRGWNDWSGTRKSMAKLSKYWSIQYLSSQDIAIRLVYLLRYKLRTYTLLGHKFSSGGTLHKSLVLINQPEYPPECMSMSNIGLAISFSSSPSSPSPSPFFYSPWAVGLYQAYTILFSFGPHKHVIFQR